MLNVLKQNKKIILGIIVVLLIPFIMPIIEILFSIILELGRLLGTKARMIEMGVCYI